MTLWFRNTGRAWEWQFSWSCSHLKAQLSYIYKVAPSHGSQLMPSAGWLTQEPTSDLFMLSALPHNMAAQVVRFLQGGSRLQIWVIQHVRWKLHHFLWPGLGSYAESFPSHSIGYKWAISPDSRGGIIYLTYWRQECQGHIVEEHVV